MIECCSGWTGLVPLEGEADQGRKVLGGGRGERKGECTREGEIRWLLGWKGKGGKGRRILGIILGPKPGKFPVKSKPA